MRNHITRSAARQAPGEVLRALRAIDETYDIHYLGDGRWAIGRVVPSLERRLIGAKMKRNIERNPNMRGMNRRLALAELAMDGFGVVAVYKLRGNPTEEIVRDARQREYRYQTDREAEFRQALDDAEARPSITDKDIEEIAYRERHVTPQLFRNAKSFTRGASNGEM
jgi:hypothetical protein